MSPEKDDTRKIFSSVMSDELNSMYRTALRMLGEHDQAEDAVQDSLAKAWRNLKKFQAGSQMKPWLFKILTNTCIDRLRARQRDRNISFEADYEIEVADTAGLSPEDTLGNSNLGGAIDNAIAALSGAQQVIVQLVIIEQFSYEEVSQVLNLPIGTVRSRLSRARMALRESLADVQNGQDNQRHKTSYLRTVK